MRLTANSLPSSQQIDFIATDTWIARIARDLNPQNPESTNIHGQLLLRADNAGFIHASGKASAHAITQCAHCGQELARDLNCDIAATFRPPFTEHAPRELTLETEDLDVYFIEDGQIDLEILVNDALQCAIPDYLVCGAEDLGGCAGRDPESTLVYGDNAPLQTESPFAVLGSLKKS